MYGLRFFRSRLKCIIIAILVIFFIDFFGLHKHMFELSYDRLFSYPMYGNVLEYAHKVRFKQDIVVYPINQYNYSFIKSCQDKCFEEGLPITPKLTFIIKSSAKNFHERLAIRKTWGYENRFSDVIIKTIFVVGRSDNVVEKHINLESEEYKDIVQADFLDNYFNNTIKTMMGFRWAVEYCPQSKFYVFVDDDFYISTKNVLRFVEKPTEYPNYIEQKNEVFQKLARRLIRSNIKNISEDISFVNKEESISSQHSVGDVKRSINKEDSKLFAGFRFISHPHRHKSSKWFVTLKEYPFDKWPPYITAGAFLLSREALLEMYFTSMYTQHFRFDDIFLAIVALKANIKPTHSQYFYFHKATYSGPHSYRYVIASHGYNDVEELLKIWTECRSAGYA